MSIEVFKWLLGAAPENLRPVETLVAISLANHAHDDGTNAYPSVERIAREMRITRRSVQGALRTLEARGVIGVQEPASRRSSTMYYFPHFRGAIDDTRGAKDDTQSSSRGAIDSDQERNPQHSGAQSTTHEGRRSCARTVSEPSSEPSGEPREGARAEVKKIARDSFALTKRPTAMTEDWVPGKTAIAWALEAGYGHSTIREETERFRDHFLGNGKRMVDWPAAWRNWLRRAPEFNGRGNAKRSNGPGYGPGYAEEPESAEDRETREQRRVAALKKAQSGRSSWEHFQERQRERGEA